MTEPTPDCRGLISRVSLPCALSALAMVNPLVALTLVVVTLSLVVLLSLLAVLSNKPARRRAAMAVLRLLLLAKGGA